MYSDTLSGKNINDHDLRSVDLSSISFDCPIIQRANFSYSNLQNTDFGSSNVLGNLNFAHADLTNAAFCRAGYGTRLENVDFTRANLTNVNFSLTKLYKVNFADANLTGADMRAVVFTGDPEGLQTANLQGAKLDISAAKFLTEEQKHQVTFYQGRFGDPVKPWQETEENPTNHWQDKLETERKSKGSDEQCIFA